MQLSITQNTKQYNFVIVYVFVCLKGNVKEVIITQRADTYAEGECALIKEHFTLDRTWRKEEKELERRDFKSQTRGTAVV